MNVTIEDVVKPEQEIETNAWSESGLTLMREGNVNYNKDNNDGDSSENNSTIVTYQFNQMNMGELRVPGNW